MKKIDGIELVENDVKSIAPDNFRHNALYEIGKFDNFVTLFLRFPMNSFFVCIEPFDFSEQMKAYMPLCPILTIDKSKKKILRSIRSRLTDNRKKIFDTNMKSDNDVMIFNCFTLYNTTDLVTVSENSNFVELSQNDLKYVSVVMSSVESSSNIIKKEGYESFGDYIKRNITIAPKEIKIDKTSDRYQSLKSLFGDDEEMIKKMYASGVNSNGRSNDRVY